MESNITAIVNIFRRGYILDQQINAIRNQSIPPKSIIIWNNGNKNIDLSKYKNDSFFKVFDCNYNSGVWSRFIISQLADTEYICIFDDDTIPGNNWFKNCMDSMKQKEALYGTIGVVFKDSGKYDVYRRYGWDSNKFGNNEIAKPVDIVGHSWFFKKEWISYFTRDQPKVNEHFCVGEDIYFSFMLQKYANIATYVPPHPMNDISLFGSLPKTAWEYGCDGNSGSNSGFTFDEALSESLNDGFQILLKRQNATSITDFNCFLNKIRNNIPFALIRPADGEYHILQNNTITNIDNWTFIKDGKLHNDLTESIHLASKKNCYVGIPCGCCNINMAKWYISNFKLHPSYTTFANVFVNKNWKNWINFLINEKIPFTFIGPCNLPNSFFVQNYINIPLHLVNEWDSKGDEYLSNILNEITKYKNRLFLFSGGPISKILVSQAWNKHPYNIYLDVGSSLDIFAKGATNREYVVENSGLSQLECKFDSNLIQI
jgi:hypothetical protein